MPIFLEPPPSSSFMWGHPWIQWFRKVFESVKELETDDAGIEGASFQTGFMVPAMRGATPPNGWILYDDGSIGNAASGATNRANADTFDLYVQIWDNYSNTVAPVATGRGVSAAADFAANKALTLPLGAGRAIGVAGSGSGLTARTAGDTTGAETVLLTANQSGIRAHDHDLLIGGGSVGAAGLSTFGSTTTPDDTRINNATAANAASAHSVMQPTTFHNWFIRL